MPPRLWQVWWVYGIPVGLVAAAMFAIADNAREAGQAHWGDLVDIARLGVYWVWFRLVWKYSRNVGLRVWTITARPPAAARLVAMGLSSPGRPSPPSWVPGLMPRCPHQPRITSS